MIIVLFFRHCLFQLFSAGAVWFLLGFRVCCGGMEWKRKGWNFHVLTRTYEKYAPVMRRISMSTRFHAFMSLQNFPRRRFGGGVVKVFDSQPKGFGFDPVCPRLIPGTHYRIIRSDFYPFNF